MVGSNSGTQFGDTTHTKIFVGGLPWETQRDTMKHYFEQFGEILEAVVITDKITGRSKGYGFVTFKDPESAVTACENPNPIIDGRRANCNLAVLGAQKKHATTPQHEDEGMKKYKAPYINTPLYFHHYNPQYASPYSSYGYPFYQQDNFTVIYNYNGYGAGGQPQFFLNPGVHYDYTSYDPFYFCPIFPQPPRGQSCPTTSSNSNPKLIRQETYLSPPQLPCLPLAATSVTSASAEPLAGKRQLPPCVQRMKYHIEDQAQMTKSD